MQVKKHKNFPFRSQCPISSTLDLIGDKWCMLIIRDLSFFDKKTFKDFSESDEKIASNILADRLKKLEELEIITKTKLPENKKTNIYTLTDKGLDLLPVIAEYIIWGAKHLEFHVAEEAKQFAAALRMDKETILAEMRKRLSPP